MTDDPRGWHSRGYLPHFDSPEAVQAVTFRLGDSLPRAVMEAWAAEPEERRRRRMERFLDAGHGACHLADPRVAALVEGAMLHFDGARYRLMAWVVMPNHVHAIVECQAAWPLGTVVRSWKTFTAREANRVLGRQGAFWQPDYHDRFIRDERHFEQARNYVQENPVKAGLAPAAGAWRWSSAWSGRG